MYSSSSFTIKKPTSSFSSPIKKPTSSFSSHILTILVPIASILLFSMFLYTDNHHSPPPLPPHTIIIKPPSPPIDSFIINTCANTLYPSLCSHTLSTFPQNLHQNNHTRLHHALQYTIQKTINRVMKARSEIMGSLNLDVREHMWVDSCVELMHLTIYELQESIKQLYPYHKDHGNYDTFESILRVAMTNKKTCMQGFSRLGLDDHNHLGIGRYISRLWTPIMHMICNSLGITKYIEYEGLVAYSCPN